MTRYMRRLGNEYPEIVGGIAFAIGVSLLAVGSEVAVWFLPLGAGAAILSGVVFQWGLGQSDESEKGLSGRGAGIAMLLFSTAMMVELVLLGAPSPISAPLASVGEMGNEGPVIVVWAICIYLFALGLLRSLGFSLGELVNSF